MPVAARPAELLLVIYGARRIFARIPKEEGLPDGLAVDSEGGVWVALFRGSEVRRYCPDGKISDRVKTPVSCPTSLCFGAPDLRTLYVTSANRYLDAAARKAEPLAGAVLTYEPGIAGLPITKIRL